MASVELLPVSGACNKWLTARLDREHALGHSFFLSPAIPDDAEDAFERLWRLDVHPLLEEYFFGDDEGLDAAGKEWAPLVAEARRMGMDVEAETASEADEAP